MDGFFYKILNNQFLNEKIFTPAKKPVLTCPTGSLVVGSALLSVGIVQLAQGSLFVGLPMVAVAAVIAAVIAKNKDVFSKQLIWEYGADKKAIDLSDSDDDDSVESPDSQKLIKPFMHMIKIPLEKRQQHLDSLLGLKGFFGVGKNKE